LTCKQFKTKANAENESLTKFGIKLILIGGAVLCIYVLIPTAKFKQSVMFYTVGDA
jgi:hypothetical protein